MTNTAIDTASAESLRAFAVSHNEIQFAHLVTAALAGEQWAARRIFAVLVIRETCGNVEGALLDAIRATDTTRPDGAIARHLKL